MGSKRIVNITLRGYIPTLNEYIKVERQHRLRAARLKRKTQANLVPQFMERKIPPFNSVRLGYNWIRPHRREDKDNIAFGQKFVQDAMVSSGVISNDGWNKVVGFTHNFSVNKELDAPELILVIMSQSLPLEAGESPAA